MSLPVSQRPPPNDLSIEEEYEQIQFDYSLNRYIVPREFSESLLRLIPQYEVCNFIQTINEVIERNERRAYNPSTSKKLSVLVCVIITFMFIGTLLVCAQIVLDSTRLYSVAGILGIVLIYISILLLVVFTAILWRSLHFMGAFAYYTPKIRKLLDRHKERFAKKHVRWELGKRVGFRQKEVEVYDLLFVHWKINVNSMHQTRFVHRGDFRSTATGLAVESIDLSMAGTINGVQLKVQLEE